MRRANDERLTTARKNFLHLFIADPAQLVAKSYAQYEAQESGFAEPWMRAYVEAFNTPADEVLTEDFLMRINAISATHLHSTEYGNYRRGEISFKLSSELRFSKDTPDTKFYSLTYNTNEQGLTNFINRWLINPKKKLHQLMIAPKENIASERSYVIAGFGDERHLIVGTTVNNIPVDFEDYNHEKHLRFFLNLLKDNNYQFRINVATAETPTKTRDMLSSITRTFLMLAKRELAAATCDNEKITAIAKLAQAIDQLHPFPGGNIRTCYILINKLLHDNKMPLCIFLNPNRLDCCDLEEVVRSINEGQYVYQKWLANSNPSEFKITLPKPFAYQRTATFKAHSFNYSIIDQFYELLTRQIEAPTTNVSRQSIFTINKQQFIDLAALKITPILDKVKNAAHRTKMLEALEQQQYSLLLRRACAYQTFNMLDVLLPLKYILNIDINEVSESSNRTALDWLNLCPDSERKTHAKALLIENHALTNEEHVNLTLG